MPSKVTLVPGSQGPRQSGSVTVPTLVQVDMDFISGDVEIEGIEAEEVSFYKMKVSIDYLV